MRAFKWVSDIATVLGLVVLVVALVTTKGGLAVLGAALLIVALAAAGLRRATVRGGSD